MFEASRKPTGQNHHQQRDSTRNQNDRFTLRSRRLHPLKPQIQPPIGGGRLVLAVSTKKIKPPGQTPLAQSLSSRAAHLQATQQNRCVLEIQATPPFSSTGFRLRLVYSDNCWQQIQPPIAPRNPTGPLCAEIQATPPSRAQDAALMYVPIIVGNRFSLRLLHATRLKFAISIFDLGNTYTRTSPPRLQNRLGQRGFTQPSRAAVCCDMGDSTLTSNRAPDW